MFFFTLDRTFFKPRRSFFEVHLKTNDVLTIFYQTKNFKIMKKCFLFAVFSFALLISSKADACTGITLQTKGGDFVVGRTIEWALTGLHSNYVVVPRGYVQRSFGKQISLRAH